MFGCAVRSLFFLCALLQVTCMNCAGCGSSSPSVASLAQHQRWCPPWRSSLAASPSGTGVAAAAPAPAVIGDCDDDELGGDGPGGEGFDYVGGGGGGAAAEVAAPEGGDAAAEDGDAAAEFDGGGADDEAALSLAKELADLVLPATVDDAPCAEDEGVDPAVEDVYVPLAAVAVPPSATLRAGSSAAADLTTRAFLSKSGVAASVGLYGKLLQVRVCVKLPSLATVKPDPVLPPPSPCRRAFQGTATTESASTSSTTRSH
jgi:hypothetical protein